MTRLSALLFFSLFSFIFALAAAAADSLLPAGAQEIFAGLVGWPRNRVEYIFLGAAWAGVFAHWWNRRRLGEIEGNFAAYLLAERRDLAFSAVTALFIYAAIMAMIMAGLVAGAAWPGALAGGLAIGWMIDAIVAPKK